MPVKDENDTKSTNPSERDYQDKIDREFSGITDNYSNETEHPLGDKESLAGAEKSAESSKPKTAQKDNVADPEKSFYNASNANGISAKLSNSPFIKNKKIAGGTIGLFFASIALIIVGLTSLGPLKFIQFSQMLQNFHFSDQETNTAKRLHNMFIYASIAGKGSGDLEKTRLGTLESIKAKKIDANLKKSGLTSVYDNGKFKGFDFEVKNLPSDHPIRNELKGVPNSDIEKRKAVVARYFNVDVSLLDGNASKITIRAEGTNNNRKIFATVLKISPDYNIATSSFAKRILIKRANLTYNPITRVKESGKQTVADKYKNWREERKARLTNNIDADVPKPGNVSTSDGDGSDPAKVGQINDANNEAGDIIDEASKGKIKLSGKLAGGAALALLSAMCTVRDVGEQANEAQVLNKIGPQMQAAAEILSVGSKIQDGGDVDLETIGKFNESLDNKETRSSWSSASSIQYENGQKPTNATYANYPELNPDSSGAASAINDAFETINETAGLGQTVNAICGAFGIFDSITGLVLDNLGPITDVMNNISNAINGALISLLAGEAVDLTDPKYAGAAFGEAANVGARLMANESSASSGGRPLNTVEAMRLKADTNAYIAATDDRTFAEKIVDVKDPKNPLGKVASSLQQKDYIGVMKSLVSVSIFTPKVSAAEAALTEQEVYYGVPKFGFDPVKLDSELVENPYENAEWVAKNLTLDSQAVKDFEECTNMRVTSDWNFESLSYPDGVITNFADMPEKCKNDDDEALYRLRVLALDTTTMKSFSCLTYDDAAACSEIYPDNLVNSTSNPVNNQAPTKDGWIWPLAKNLKQGPCWNVRTSSGYHAGIDINTDNIGTDNPAIAAHDGTVVKTGYDNAAGNYITIRSSDDIYYSYEHLSKVQVKVNDTVTAGQVVGLVGKTGHTSGVSSAGHLHFVTSRSNTLGAYSPSPQQNTFDPLTVLPTTAPNGYECLK